MIASLPVWLIVAALVVLAGVILLLRGLRMPSSHAANQKRREALKRKRAEIDMSSEEDGPG